MNVWTDRQTDRQNSPTSHIYGACSSITERMFNSPYTLHNTQCQVQSKNPFTFQLLQVLSVIVAQEQYMAIVSYHWHYRCFSTDSISLLKLPLLVYACLCLPLGIHVSEYSFTDNSDVV